MSDELKPLSAKDMRDISTAVMSHLRNDKERRVMRILAGITADIGMRAEHAHDHHDIELDGELTTLEFKAGYDTHLIVELQKLGYHLKKLPNGILRVRWDEGRVQEQGWYSEGQKGDM